MLCPAMTPIPNEHQIDTFRSQSLAALGPGVEARGKVPPCTFKLLNAGGHTYYFTSSVVRPALLDVDAAQLEHEEEPTEVVNSRVVNHWYEVISQKLQSVAVNSVFGSDKPKVPRPILRFPFCDKKTMASVLIGMASARTRVSVVGGFLSGGKEKAKSILIKVFDEQGLFGLYKVPFDPVRFGSSLGSAHSHLTASDYS